MPAKKKKKKKKTLSCRYVASVRSHFGSRLQQAIIYQVTAAVVDHRAMDMMKQKAKEEIEKQMGEQAPPMMKCFFPCCGGPVGTMEKMIWMVPADKQDNVKSAIEKYKSM
mmetsp:Transcript_15091/g.12135  ORF Transcript_15091/g.12135 Transcript_15091/m.12135 type:complete len:110 (-) Transcript_15091:158-487(-)